ECFHRPFGQVVQVVDDHQVRPAEAGKVLLLVVGLVTLPRRHQVARRVTDGDTVGSARGNRRKEGTGEVTLPRSRRTVQEKWVEANGRPSRTDGVRNPIGGGPRQAVLRQCNPAYECLHAAWISVTRRRSGRAAAVPQYCSEKRPHSQG